MLADSRPLALAPVYDMLPMLWRPSAQGALVTRAIAVAIPAPGQLAWWRWAANAGLHFWAAVAAEPVIDAELRRSAGEAQAAIQRALQWFAQE